jgi:hypothetical protein
MYYIKMNNDTLTNILLLSDIDTITSMCLTSKNISNLCHDKNFWVSKFNMDNIPLLYINEPTNMKQWIKEYKKIKNASITANKVLNILKVENADIDYILLKFENNEPITTLLPISFQNIINLNNKDTQEIAISYIGNNDTKIIYSLYDKDTDNEIVTVSQKISDITIKKILTSLIYYYPYIKIVDENDDLYTYNDISDFKNKYKRLNKVMKNRLILWKVV